MGRAQEHMEMRRVTTEIFFADAVRAISCKVLFSLSIIAWVSLWYGIVSFVRVPLFVPHVFRLLNSVPQSVWINAVLFPVVFSSARIHSLVFSLACVLSRIGIAVQYRLKSSIMVRIYFFPNHSFDRGPIRSAWILSMVFVVRIGPAGLGLDGGFVLLPFRHAVQVPVPDRPLASGRERRVSNEMCPYLSWRP